MQANPSLFGDEQLETKQTFCRFLLCFIPRKSFFRLDHLAKLVGLSFNFINKAAGRLMRCRRLEVGDKTVMPETRRSSRGARQEGRSACFGFGLVGQQKRLKDEPSKPEANPPRILFRNAHKAL